MAGGSRRVYSESARPHPVRREVKGHQLQETATFRTQPWTSISQHKVCLSVGVARGVVGLWCRAAVSATDNEYCIVLS